MGNENSSLPPTLDKLPPHSFITQTKATPKLSLMKLKNRKSMYLEPRKLNEDEKGRNQVDEQSLDQAIVADEMVPMRLSLENMKVKLMASNTQPTIVLAQIKSVMLDSQSDVESCDDDCIDDEDAKDEINNKDNGELDLMAAPFAVTRLDKNEVDNKSESSTTACDMADKRVPKFQFSQKKLATPNNKPRFNNTNNEAYKKRVSATKNILLEALFKTIKVCHICGKAFPDDNSCMTAPCGHTFHYKCIEDRPRCTVCNEIIEKGFTI